MWKEWKKGNVGSPLHGSGGADGVTVGGAVVGRWGGGEVGRAIGVAVVVILATARRRRRQRHGSGDGDGEDGGGGGDGGGAHQHLEEDDEDEEDGEDLEEEERHRPRSPAGDGHDVSSKDGPRARHAGSRTGQRDSRRLGAAGCGAREPAGRNGRDACWAVEGACDGIETWAAASSGAAAAHLDGAAQAAVDLGIAGSAVAEVVGSKRPDNFSFSLRSSRCQWEKEDLATPICEPGESITGSVTVQLRALCVAVHPLFN